MFTILLQRYRVPQSSFPVFETLSQAETLEIEVLGLAVRIQTSGIRASGLGFRGQGLGLRLRVLMSVACRAHVRLSRTLDTRLLKRTVLNRASVRARFAVM